MLLLDLGSAGDSTRKHNLEDTAAVKAERVKKYRKDGPQESKDSALINLIDDVGFPAKETSNAQTSGTETVVFLSFSLKG